MTWTLGDIALALGSHQSLQAPELHVSGVSTDTRTLERGSLFVPLVGENFDGHDYAETAVKEKGACALVWARPELPAWLVDFPNVVVFQVEDTLLAYQALGLYWKKKCGVRCVAITGSVGKTTTKEFLAHFLSRHFVVHKSKANYNNDIGVPKTLLELRPEQEVAIVEMGMRGRGEIARLVKAAEPEIGIITAIGTSHIELLGSRENIALAKAELVQGLPPQGRAILPLSDDYIELLSELAEAPILSFSAGADAGADIHPERVVAKDEESTTFLYQGREYRLPLPGQHHLHDLFAVLAAGQALGIKPEDMLKDISSLKHPEGRAEWIRLGGARIYLDCYNSAPESLRASLDVLKQSQGRKLAVLGDMLELGDEGPRAHREIGGQLVEYGVSLALCYGPLSQEMADQARVAGVDARWFSDKSGMADVLGSELREGDTVLVKASRGMALETVVNAIKERVQ